MAGAKRLSENVKPTNYRIDIETNLSTFKFSGQESIELTVSKPTKSLELHSKMLKLSEAEIESKGMKQKARISEDKANEMVVLRFNSSVRGQATLHIRFEGNNDEKLRGFYRSRFGSGKGNNGYILSTQLEPSDARKIFPCFDEPAFKATFDISLTVDEELTAISNMPAKSTLKIGKRKKVSFARTMKMSTYLVYLGVGRFERVSGTLHGRQISVVTVPGRKNAGRFALEHCKNFLTFYEKYFGIPYPLPKLDLIAIPDFSPAAMENWGAIAFRDTELLVDNKSSIWARMEVARTLSHELAHQWFGDLVTMDWWEDLWLNESFATFMSYKPRDATMPKWNVWFDFYEQEMYTALTHDQLKGTHPIYANIKSADEINALFDAISYSKGASVLNMLEDFVGKEAFRKGLHSYLVKHSLKNATKDDLWDALKAASRKKDVAKLANDWITKEGFPAIYVNGNRIYQKRFFLSKRIGEEGVWPVPVHYLQDNGQVGSMLLKTREATIGTKGMKWAKLNLGQNGLYRVFYDQKTFASICEAAARHRFKEIDAWGIIVDTFMMARSGRIKVEKYLGYIKSFENYGYPVNYELLSQFAFLCRMFHDTKLGERLKAHAIAYALRILDREGWKSRKDESPDEKKLRSNAISLLGTLRYGPVVARCNRIFGSEKSRNSVDPDIRRSVYSTVAGNGNERTFEKMIALYRKNEKIEEKDDLLMSLAEFRQPNLIKKVLDFSISKEVRLGDSAFLILATSANVFATQISWRWVKKRWKKLMDMYSLGAELLDRVVFGCMLMDTVKDMEDFSAFFAKKENRRDDIAATVEKIIERISINIDCRDFNLK